MFETGLVLEDSCWAELAPQSGKECSKWRGVEVCLCMVDTHVNLHVSMLCFQVFTYMKAT